MAEPLARVWVRNPEKLKKHCKLYTFKKYFVRHMWCQNDEMVTLPAMLYGGGVTVKFSPWIFVDVAGASDRS